MSPISEAIVRPSSSATPGQPPGTDVLTFSFGTIDP
jgi:hypothetical protein